MGQGSRRFRSSSLSDKSSRSLKQMDLDLDQNIIDFVFETLRPEKIDHVTQVQELWSGYGKIARIKLIGAKLPSVILKSISPPQKPIHPRGWNTSVGHERKLKSYEIERRWYEQWSKICPRLCRVPTFLAAKTITNTNLLLLEDLDAVGYPARFDKLSDKGIDACLSWLGAFHARFFNEQGVGLWERGAYWHLATRKAEYERIGHRELKENAGGLDKSLEHACFKTIIHGDAKIANFCFSEDQSKVAALDFQYVGTGIGVVDLAYFMGSCLDEDELFEKHSWCLNRYFLHLKNCLSDKPNELASAIEEEWRQLYPVAVADFARFLQGWNPGHWKLNDYTEFHICEALKILNN